ncbi:MAG: shikimate dehydrogenase [Alphaproteobacteria bacterium]
MAAAALKLGLIGGNIALSNAPRLHRLAGALSGLSVSYDLLVPSALGLDLDAMLDRCRAERYRGVNVTYPYKEAAAARVAIPDPLVAAIGAVNTVLFEPDGPVGHNTDHSGFVGVLRDAFGPAVPGPVCMVGCGGVGRAIAFALVRCGVADVRLVDSDPARAGGLADALGRAGFGGSVRVCAAVGEAARGAAGLVNCTPVGMDGHPGTPVPPAAMAGAAWAFDAVYTPRDTLFLQDAAAAGLRVIEGYALFFRQGVDAGALVSGRPVDPAALRAALAA